MKNYKKYFTLIDKSSAQFYKCQLELIKKFPPPGYFLVFTTVTAAQLIWKLFSKRNFQAGLLSLNHRKVDVRV